MSVTLDAHALWAYAHILLFVYWLGADVGLYAVMAFVKDARLSFETRTMAWAVLLYVLIAGVAFLGRVKPF